MDTCWSSKGLSKKGKNVKGVAQSPDGVVRWVGGCGWSWQMVGGWTRNGTKARRWVVVGLMGLWAQSDRMLSIGDEWNMYRVPKVVPKRKFADGHGTDGEQALAGGTKVVHACLAGLILIFCQKMLH